MGALVGDGLDAVGGGGEQFVRKVRQSTRNCYFLADLGDFRISRITARLPVAEHVPAVFQDQTRLRVRVAIVLADGQPDRPTISCAHDLHHLPRVPPSSQAVPESGN